MGKRKHRRRDSSSSSSSSNSSTDRRVRTYKAKRKNYRSYTPELPPSASSGLTDIFNILKHAYRPKLSMSVKDSDINEFNPVVDNVNEWIERVDERVNVYRWDDINTCHLVINKLKGPAEKWYRSLATLPKTWAEWKIILANTFPPTRDLHLLMTKMLALQPKSNQSLYEYCYEKLALIKKMNLNLSGVDEVNLIIGGLENSNAKFAVKAANIDDPSKLAVYLKAFEPPVTDLKINKHNPVSATNVKTQVELVERNRNKLRHITKCYNCNRPGHKQYDCPNTIVQGGTKLYCNYCRQKGHTIDTCFKKNKKHQGHSTNHNQKQNNKQVFLVSTSETKNKFYKSVLINGVKAQCFVDFGSECSLTTFDFAQKLNLKLCKLPKVLTLTVFGGYEIEVTTKTTCCVTIDSVKMTIDVLVLEKCIPGVDLVIGQNFTEDTRIKYARIGTELRFSNTIGVNVVQAQPKVIVKIGTENEDIKRQLRDIIKKYSACFPSDNMKLGTISGVEMTVKLTNEQPVVQRPYRLAEAEKDVLRGLVNNLLEAGIIRPSQSPFASPVIMVKKKTGQQRLCVDYRLVNKQTLKENYPLPLIEDLIDRLAGHKYFTTLDCRSGYHQIKMSEESIPITAFITPDGKFEYLKVPFGLKNAPYVFQKAIDYVLGDLRYTKVLVYLDDILIPSKTLEEGLETLEIVLQRLQNHGVCLNMEKCYFLQDEIEYLGYIIKAGQISPNPAKVTAIKEFPVPKDVHQVRQFLGVVGHFRKFVPRFAHLSKPLTVLLKKNTTWSWSSPQQDAFEKFKELMVKEPILTLYDNKRETILYTDASHIGLAGMLTQIHDGKEKVVGYYSRTTSPTEQRYHSFELETLAIVQSIKRFRHYLVGINFKIITDCAAVKNAVSKRDLNKRIGRWILDLQEYDFEILHRPGNRMTHVDALSRNPAIDNTRGVYATFLSEDDWILVAQEADPDVSSIKTILQSGERHINKDIFSQYDLRKGRVYRRTEHGNRAVLPKSCKWQILRFNHDDIGHFSFDKTYERIASKFWFSKMRRFTKKYVQACINCMFYKSPSGKRHGYLHPIPKAPRPFHTIHIDHLGPMCKSKQGNSYVLTIVDAFTKFCFVRSVPNTKTKYVVTELNNIMQIFGVPRRIISDRGKSFVSQKFREFCEQKNITHHLNAVGMPRGNGQVERYNKTILDALSTMGADRDDDEWDDNILNIQLGINNTINRGIDAVPSEVLLGYRSGPSNVGTVVDHDDPDAVDVTALRNKITDKIKVMQAQQKDKFDAHRAEPVNYSEGDLVLVKISSIVSTGQSKKLVPKWKGPFKVSKVLENDRYEVKGIFGSERSRVPYTGVYAIEHMKKWNPPEL